MINNEPDSDIEVVLNGIPAKKVEIIQYMIDRYNNNSYEAWKKMGSPQNPTPEQYLALEKAGKLQPTELPDRKKVKEGSLTLSFMIPRQGVELLVIRWD